MDHLHTKGTLFEAAPITLRPGQIDKAPTPVEQNSNALDSQPVEDHKTSAPDHDPKLAAMHDKLMAIRGAKDSIEMDKSEMCKGCDNPSDSCKCMKAGMSYKGLKKMEELQKEQAPKAKKKAVRKSEEAKPVENTYKCPKCSHSWKLNTDSGHDDECPSCGNRAITPQKSVKKSEVNELAEQVRDALKQIRSIKRGD